MGVHCDGADAELCVMPATNVYAIPDSLSDEEAAFTEPLACAVHGVDLAGVRLGDTVLIVGGGPMGNLITQCAAHAGAATIVVSEPIALRRELAVAHGATHVIDPDSPGRGEGDEEDPRASARTWSSRWPATAPPRPPASPSPARAARSCSSG